MRVVRSTFDVTVRDETSVFSATDLQAAAIFIDCRKNHELADTILRQLKVHEVSPRPFIAVLIDNAEPDKAWAVTAGIDDVLLCPYSLLDLQLRTGAILALIGQQQDIRRLARVVDGVTEEARRLRTLAYTDHLTGLPNRLYLDNWVSELALKREGTTSFALHMLDLDGFKKVNDQYGHQAGDTLLKQVSERVSKVPRRLDIVVRLGGDEIAVVQMGAVHVTDCTAFAQRLQAMFTEAFIIDGHVINISASVGTALYPDDGDNFPDLLRHADVAMYAAKATGPGKLSIFNAERETPLVQGSSAAINEKQMNEASYALTFSLATGELRGVFVEPESRPFVNGAALDSLNGTEWIEEQIRQLEIAFLQSVSWKTAFMPIVFGASIHASVFSTFGVIQRIRDLLLVTGADPTSCEVTLEAPNLLEEVKYLHQVRDLGLGLGAHIDIESFTLQRMLRLPVTKLHLTREFTETTVGDGNAEIMVEAAVLFARSIRARTVAYGVETREQMDALRALGVDNATGPFVGSAATGSRLSTLRQRIQQQHSHAVD